MIGANGAGKTTLFRMITGQEEPDSGTLELGDTVELAYVDQSRDAWTPARPCGRRSPAARTSSRSGNGKVNSRQYTAGFNFKGSDQQKRVGVLSGGERNRVHLAKVLSAGATCCCSTSPPTTSTWTRCGRSSRRCSRSPGARW